MGIGSKFQEETKYVRGKIPAGYYDGHHVPAPFAIGDRPKVELPPAPPPGGMSLWEALARRRSERSYGQGPLTAQELSHLLWASSGATREVGGHVLRTAPSAGALYPIETYVGVKSVSGIAAGLYHYAAREHALSPVRQADLSGDLCEAALGQKMVKEAAVVFLWTARFGRSTAKYLERAYRYVYLDAGHMAQNLLLAATALGAAACPIAAFFDDEVNAVMGIDGTEESILYSASVGRARGDGH